jgi:hypothetical protein
MNERLKQLAIEAKLIAPEYNGFDHTRLSISQQKFAELIVEECADLFVDRRYMVLNPLEPFANERVRALKAHDKDTVKTIKQHFGVDE